MASASISSKFDEHGGVPPNTNERQLVTGAACHGNGQGTRDKSSTAKRKDQEKDKKCSLKSVKTKSSQKTSKMTQTTQTKNENGKLETATNKDKRICTNPHRETLNSKFEEVQKSMSFLKISDTEKAGGESGRVDDVTLRIRDNSLEIQMKRLSLEGELLERGATRNKDSHTAHQSTPYDRPTGQRSSNTVHSTDTSYGYDMNKFINSVISGNHTDGIQDGISAVENSGCVQTSSQGGIDNAGQWLDDAASSSINSAVSPHDIRYNSPCQVPSYMFGTYTTAPMNFSVISSGDMFTYQPPTNIPCNGYVYPHLPGQLQENHAAQPGRALPSIPTTMPAASNQQLTNDQLSQHVIPTQVASVSSVQVPTLNNTFTGDVVFFHHHPVMMNYNMAGSTNTNVQQGVYTDLPPGMYYPSASSQQPSANVTLRNSGVPNDSNNGKVCSDNVAPSQTDITRSSVSERDPCIPNFVLIDDDPVTEKKTKKGKAKKKNSEAASKKITSATKTGKRGKAPEKKTSHPVPSQSPLSSSSRNLPEENSTASSPAFCEPLSAVSDESTQSTDQHANFEDALSVVQDNLQEDFLANIARKKSNDNLKQKESDTFVIDDIPTPGNSEETSKPQHLYDCAYTPNSNSHSQSYVPLVASPHETVRQTSQSCPHCSIPNHPQSRFSATVAPVNTSPSHLPYSSAHQILQVTQTLQSAQATGASPALQQPVAPPPQVVRSNFTDFGTQVRVDVTCPGMDTAVQKINDSNYPQMPGNGPTFVQHMSNSAFLGQFKMTTAGIPGAQPMGAKFNLIMNKFTPILPKPIVSQGQ